MSAENGGVAMSEDLDGRVIRLESLELTFHASTADEGSLKRRFMTLLVPAAARPGWRGGVGYVVRVTSLATGESFALKRLRERVVPATGLGGDRGSEKLVAAFRREYDAHRALSSTGLVPKVFGWATIEGEPAILMEWVEGLTLRDAARELRGTDGRVPLAAIADIGISVLGALRRVGDVSPNLAHRDLSPRNIMFRTGVRSLPEQADTGFYDVCLVDFGSASLGQDDDTSFTASEDLWRGATPDYAAPEMLGRDGEGPRRFAVLPPSMSSRFAACSTSFTRGGFPMS